MKDRELPMRLKNGLNLKKKCLEEENDVNEPNQNEAKEEIEVNEPNQNEAKDELKARKNKCQQQKIKCYII